MNTYDVKKLLRIIQTLQGVTKELINFNDLMVDEIRAEGEKTVGEQIVHDVSRQKIKRVLIPMNME